MRLRQVCAEDALKDPDPATRSLLLGFNSVHEYATWIRNAARHQNVYIGLGYVSWCLQNTMFVLSVECSKEEYISISIHI